MPLTSWSRSKVNNLFSCNVSPKPLDVAASNFQVDKLQDVEGTEQHFV